MKSENFIFTYFMLHVIIKYITITTVTLPQGEIYADNCGGFKKKNF